MTLSGLAENPAIREIAADCLCGHALTGTRKAINKQDMRARDGRLHRGARDHTIPQLGGSPPYNLSYRSVAAEPQADAFGRPDIAVSSVSATRRQRSARSRFPVLRSINPGPSVLAELSIL